MGLRLGLGLDCLLQAGMAPEAFGQDNRWVTVSPAFHAPDRYPGTTLSSYNGWTSLRYNTRDSAVVAWRMVLDARRHNGIYANALVLWSLRRNRLDLVTASNYAGGTYDAAPSFTLMPEFATDTTPAPRHPYDAMAYVDTTHALYMLLGATPRIVNFEASPSVTPRDLWDAHEVDGLSTWKYSFGEGRWRRIPENIRKFWPSPYYCGGCVPFHDNHLVHWKSAHKLLFVEGRGTHAAVMDLARETWDTLALANHSPFDLTQALSAWDSRRERLILRAGDSVCAFDPSTRRFTLLPNAGLDQGADRAMYTGIAYVTSRDAYLAVGRDGTTRVFDPEGGAWRTVSTGSIGLDGGEGNLQMEYDPATDQVVLSTAASGDLGGFRTFRYRPEGTALDKDRRSPGRGKGPNRGIGVAREGPRRLKLQWSGIRGEASVILRDFRGRRVAELRCLGEDLEKGLSWNVPELPRGLLSLDARARGNVTAGRLLILR